jgi:dihydrofolate reductase
MRKISVFIHVSLDGFFAGPNDEIDWFKIIKKDPEWEKHTSENRTPVVHSSSAEEPTK